MQVTVPRNLRDVLIAISAHNPFRKILHSTESNEFDYNFLLLRLLLDARTWSKFVLGLLSGQQLSASFWQHNCHDSQSEDRTVSAAIAQLNRRKFTEVASARDLGKSWQAFGSSFHQPPKREAGVWSLTQICISKFDKAWESLAPTLRWKSCLSHRYLLGQEQ